MRWVVISQSIAILGSSLVFPFYLIFIKEVGGGFLQYGISYGLFTVSSALVHILSREAFRFGRKEALFVNGLMGNGYFAIVFPFSYGGLGSLCTSNPPWDCRCYAKDE